MSVEVFKDGQRELIPNEELDRYLTMGYSVEDPERPSTALEIVYPVHIPEDTDSEEAERQVLAEMGINPEPSRTEQDVLTDMGIVSPIEIVYP